MGPRPYDGRVPPKSVRRGALALLLALAVTGGIALAAATTADVAVVARQAERDDVPLGDLAVVYSVGVAEPDLIAATEQVAAATGAVSTVGRSGTLHVRQVARPGAVAYAPPDGYTFPLVFAAYPAPALGWLFGHDVAAAAVPAAGRSGVVLNAASAELTGAEVGDTLEVITRSGDAVALRVAAIVPQEVLGGTEVVFVDSVADRLGETRPTRVVIWGFDDRGAIDAALADSGLAARRNTQVARSWDPPKPDSVLDTLEVKQLLGTPWYRILDGGNSVTMHPQWQATNLPDNRELLNDQIPVRARCNVAIVADLRAALAEVASAGLGGAIDVQNANTYGGCYNPRFARESWNLSRHSYGIALDTNTATNCVGCTPTMNCDVVRIFRRHNFAWGGNFYRPDGMHFEWVGEPRDQVPSRPVDRCPNNVPAASAGGRVAAEPEIGRAALDLGLDASS